MDTDALMSVFGQLPYLDPFMHVNLSGTCATTKLIQCRNFGIDMCSVARKFTKSPREVPDLDEAEFLARKRLAAQVESWCRADGRRTRWTPILYGYKIVQGSARRNQDWGHMVWTDPTLTRFLIVMLFGPPSCNCGNPFHNDYHALTKLHADKFMSLLNYVYHTNPQPKWVRATYTTFAQGLNPSFLASEQNLPSASPPIFHITLSSFVPSLTSSELERIDNLMSRSSSLKRPPAALRRAVLEDKKARPKTGENLPWMKAKVEQECAWCHKVAGGKALKMCGECKLVFYCNKKCQKKARPTHKLICKKAVDPVSEDHSNEETSQETQPEYELAKPIYSEIKTIEHVASVSVPTAPAVSLGSATSLWALFVFVLAAAIPSVYFLR